MSDKVREAGEYVAALKRAACGSGDKQADDYLSDMIDSVVGIVRAAALEEAANVCDDEAAEWEAQVESAGKLSSITKHAVESTAVGARRCARRVRALAGRGA